MPDSEKVIKGLLCIKGDYIPCATCKYTNADGYGRGNRCKEQCASDALALLKEQEAVKPKLVGVNTWICGECEALLGWEDFSRSGLELIEYKFCPECGHEVKWE